MPYVNGECPNERVHQCCLLWTSSVRRHILQYPLILQAGKERPDQYVNVQADLGLRCPQLIKGPFRALRIICFPPKNSHHPVTLLSVAFFM